MILFWNSLLKNTNKLSSILYKMMLTLHATQPVKFKWISYTKFILDEIGLSYIQTNQIPLNRSFLKSLIKQKLNDNFIQNRFSQINNTSRGEFYSIFKSEFQLESYLLKLNATERLPITKLRCSNFRFPIETGRWSGVRKNDRTCNLCGKSVGNEFNYLFICYHQYIGYL